MSIDIEKWISHLPIAEEEELAAEGILLGGRLISGKTGEICVQSGPLILTFSQDDILQMEKSPVEEDQSIIVIRREAPLLESRPSELCDLTTSKRRPFALAVRSRDIIAGPGRRFRNLERQFLANEGLLEE
jgi:hypothetical protein